MIKISGNYRIPPAQFIGYTRTGGNIFKYAMIILQEGYRHPLACKDQVGPSVIIKIAEGGIAYHADTGQVFSNRRCYISKFDLSVFAVISENKTRNRFRIIPWINPAGYKQVELSVLIKIYCPYA